MKLPNLRTLLFLQPFFHILYPLYAILVWNDVFVLPFHWCMAILFIGLSAEAWVEKRIKAQTDECALQTLRAAESSCFHSGETVIIGVLMLVAANQIEPVFPWVMEHMPVILTGMVFLIYLERAILFAYWDKKGLPPC